MSFRALILSTWAGTMTSHCSTQATPAGAPPSLCPRTPPQTRRYETAPPAFLSEPPHCSPPTLILPASRHTPTKGKLRQCQLIGTCAEGARQEVVCPDLKRPLHLKSFQGHHRQSCSGKPGGGLRALTDLCSAARVARPHPGRSAQDPRWPSSQQ